MDPNSRYFFEQKQRELSETMKSLQAQLSAVKVEVDVSNTKIKPLKSRLDHITDEINELKKSLQKENERLDEYTLKLAKTHWVQTTTILAANNEKATMQIYYKIMQMHKEKSLITTSDALKKPNGELSNHDNLMEVNNKVCVKSPQIIETEELAAHFHRTRLKNQDTLSEAKKQNCVLQKRNAATLLRMRKNLQECERVRKKLADRKNELLMDISRN